MAGRGSPGYWLWNRAESQKGWGQPEAGAGVSQVGADILGHAASWPGAAASQKEGQRLPEEMHIDPAQLGRPLLTQLALPF